MYRRYELEFILSFNKTHLIEYVLKRKLITEDCSKNEEYCSTTHSRTSIDLETAICRPSHQIDCNETLAQNNSQEKCFENRIAFCSQKPRIVTVTLKRQPCGPNAKMKATKMCITHADGQWSCQNFTHDNCQETNVTKIISTEATMDGLECSEKQLPPLCLNQTCSLISNEQKCLKDIVQTDVVVSLNSNPAASA